ncbi:MAG: type II secretion system GspH family protein, partial [Candidatus Omnitrophica bacterium]|nr:type II secretion system GspH family protein [Candidatus Omnitrophota bacterium]
MKKRAITLIEIIAVIVVLAIAIPTLSIMLVNASWSSARSEALADAAIYAQELMEEIKSKRFDENASSPWSSTLGVDSAESSSDRTTFDDVDDFVGCT